MITLRAVGLGCVLTAATVLAGCSTVVTGTAQRAENAVPDDVPPLREAQLTGLLLSADDLNGIVGSSSMDVVSDVEEMQDSSRIVSDPDCLGSIFASEQDVYGTGWTAVRDQVIREPGDDNEHWAEQTVVLYPSRSGARGFVDESRPKWADCGGFSIAVDDSQGSYIWKVDDPAADGDVITQVVAQEDADGWDCQHTLTSVSNVVVETLACAYGVRDEALAMSAEIVDRAIEAAG